MSEEVGVNPYEILQSPHQREIIKRRTVDLVRATDQKKAVIFLDKMARPLAQIYREVYPALRPDTTMPTVQFAKIGREKLLSLRAYTVNVLNTEYPEDPEERVSIFKTAADIDAVYGVNNREDLERLLQSLPSGNKLIVDDFVNRGDTSALALRLFGLLDDKSIYDFFPFINADKDKEAFLEGDGFTLPWKTTGSLVANHDVSGISAAERRGHILDRDDSFITVPSSLPGVRSGGIKIRNELSSLAKEIIAENKTSPPSIAS